MGHFILSVKHHFSAARALRDYEGKCQNIHGHNYEVEVRIATQESAKGYALDFHEVKLYLTEILAEYDLANLNELVPFNTLNPTTENIAKWLYGELNGYVMGKQALLQSVTVRENHQFAATYFPSAFPLHD